MLYYLMLCHHRPEQVKLCLENAIDVCRAGGTFILLNQHYPLGGEEKNTRKLEKCVAQLSKRAKIELFDAGEGLGCSRGVKYCLDKIDFSDDDILITYDPDERPITVGFDKILTEIVTTDERFPLASCMHLNIEIELHQRGADTSMVGEHRVYSSRTPCIWSVQAWRGDWLNAVGGYSDASGGDYGLVENKMWGNLARTGKRHCYASDAWVWTWPDCTKFIDKEYLAWKWDYGQRGIRISFTDWLKARNLL